MRNRIARGIANHIRRAKPMSVSAVSATALTRILLANASPQHGEPRLLHLKDAHVTGAFEPWSATFGIPLVFENCTFEQPVMMHHTEVSTLEFRACTLPAFEGRALRVNGDLAFTESRIGRIDLFGASVGGQLWLTGAHVGDPANTSYVINAPNIHVAGGIHAWHLSADGPINLWGAEVGASLEFVKASLSSSSGDPRALRARNLKAQLDVTITDCTIEGRIDLFGARIGAQLWLNSTQVRVQEGHAISAPNITVAGGCYAPGLTILGGLNLWGADIGSGIELSNATLVGGEGAALRASMMSVRGEVSLDRGVKVSGEVDFSSATVDGHLTLRYEVDSDHALSLAECHVKALQLEISPGDRVRADLSGAVCTSFLDSRESWPKVLDLDRTKYDTLRPLLPARERLSWLERNKDSESPHPYEQLARHYRETGHDHDARVVLLAKHRNLTRQLRLPGRLWGHLQDLTIGYGYRPVRALCWLAGLVTVVWVCGVVWEPRPVTGAAPAFNAAVYALDVVLPILDLGQERAYTAVGVGRVVVWTAIMAGWVLASTVIAAVTRNVSRG